MRTVRVYDDSEPRFYTVKAKGVVVRVVEATGFDDAEKKFLTWAKTARPKFQSGQALSIAFLTRAKDVIR